MKRTPHTPTTFREDLVSFQTYTRIARYSRTDKDTYYKIVTYMIIHNEEVIISTAYGSPDKLENLQFILGYDFTQHATKETTDHD